MAAYLTVTPVGLALLMARGDSVGTQGPWDGRVEMVSFLILHGALHLGLVGLGIAAYALARRHRGLLVGALPLVLLTLGPRLAELLTPRPDVPASQTLRVATANLYYKLEDRAALAARLTDLDVDVLMLQEYTSAWHQDLAPGLASRFPHARADHRPGSSGMAVYSRFPLGPSQRLGKEGHGSCFAIQRVALELDGGEVGLYNVHTLAPLRPEQFEWTWEVLAGLHARLEREAAPLIVAGDFNATTFSPHHRALTDRGFVEVPPDRDQGLGSTWPARTPLRFFPGFRMDHVYVRGGLLPLGCRYLDSEGSDHRPVVARVGLPGGLEMPRRAP